MVVLEWSTDVLVRAEARARARARGRGGRASERWHFLSIREKVPAQAAHKPASSASSARAREERVESTQSVSRRRVWKGSLLIHHHWRPCNAAEGGMSGECD